MAEETINLSYNIGSPINLSLLDFRGNFDITLWSLKQGSETDTIKGLPFSAQVYENMIIHVRLIPRLSVGNQPPVADIGQDIVMYAPENSNQLGDYKFQLTVADNEGATSTDLAIVSVLPPEQIDFTLTLPLDGAMVTGVRKPTLAWDAYSGATKYEVFMNITRDDYEWHASGNLLDRYTKIGESTTNSFTLSNELLDRWTYKWYVIATTATGKKYSNKQQFGLYLPVIEQESDGVGLVDGCRDLNKNGTIESFENWKLTPEERLVDLMNRLTTEEKIAQLFYGGDNNPIEGFAFSYGVEGGMRDVQRAASKSRMGIPVAFLGDKMHGWKTIYPTQLGLAATRDMDLAYQCGNMHRVEQKSFGFTGTLAPLAEVATKVLYPRIQEGGGENADEVAAMVRALVCGMQGGPEINPHSMLVTVKHWPSQGAGGEGPTQYDEVTIKYHMKPWHAAVDTNAASVMPGYSSSPFLDSSGAGANSSKKIIDYLRNEIKFQGFVVTDWLAANTKQSIESIGAGIDVLGGAPLNKYEGGQFVEAYTKIEELINAVGMDRINESTSRVLDTKIRLGMLENPYADPTCTWTNKEHHALALKAAEKSITLLKNEGGLLPLKLGGNDEIVVGGARATWDGQIKDPNVIWQSIYYDNPQVKNFYKAIQERGETDGVKVYQDKSANPKVALVVIGEESYTHGTQWADKDPNIPEDQLAVIRNFRDAGVKVITVVILPRPYVLTPIVEMSDAILVIYRGGNGVGQAVAECVFGDFVPSGKLPFQLPRSQEQVGTDDQNNQLERWELPYDIGASDQ